jgi:hypothetical protein
VGGEQSAVGAKNKPAAAELQIQQRPVRVGSERSAIEVVLKTVSEKGTVPFFSPGIEKSGQSPTVLSLPSAALGHFVGSSGETLDC